MNIFTVKLSYYRMTFGPKPNYCEFSSTFEAADWRDAVENCIKYLQDQVGELNFVEVSVKRSRCGDES